MPSTQFTCFTGTKVHILTPEARAACQAFPIPVYKAYMTVKMNWESLSLTFKEMDLNLDGVVRWVLALPVQKYEY
jgi:hypothetical protein